LQVLPRLRLVDGTTVSEPGDTGSTWRLRYSVTLPGLACDEVVVSSPKLGETLRRYRVHAGDIFIADRGFANAHGVAHVVDGQADVIVRTNLVTLPLFALDGQRIDVLIRLRQFGVSHYSGSPCANTNIQATSGTPSTTGDWPVAVRAGKRLIKGRLCAIKKSAAATHIGQARVRRESQRGGTKVQPETMEAAGYVFVFTTLGSAYTATQILESVPDALADRVSLQASEVFVGSGALEKARRTGCASVATR
jgi:hypothetical protein